MLYGKGCLNFYNYSFIRTYRYWGVYLLKSESLENENVGILRGRVMLRTGNCMPLICDSPHCSSSCSQEGVRREINIREVSMHEPNDEYGRIIKTITSGLDGNFTTTLPQGNYSIFVVEDGKDYCNLFFDYNNSIVNCPVRIIENETANFDLVVNYAAD